MSRTQFLMGRPVGRPTDHVKKREVPVGTPYLVVTDRM